MEKSKGRPSPSQEVELANNLVKRNIRRIWMMIGLSVLLVAGIMGFFVAFPRITHSQKFIQMDWIDWQGKPVIVSVWSETADTEDDGICLRGYEVRCTDPLEKKELGKLYLERSLNDLPSGPGLYVGDKGDVWILSAKDNVGASEGYVRHLKLLPDGNFQEVATPILTGYTPIGGFLGASFMVRNTFNEDQCFDVESQQFVEDGCQWGSDNLYRKGAFFLVSKTSGSTRSKLWHLVTDSAAPEPGITVGIVTGDRPMDGVHVLNDLSSSNYRVTEERLAYYQTHTDPKSYRFNCITPGDYWVDAAVKFQDSIRVVVQLPGTEPETFQLISFGADGRQLWKTDIGAALNAYSKLTVETVGNQAIVLARNDFAMAIDDKTGKVLWQFNP
jgi:hypothetical protein